MNKKFYVEDLFHRKLLMAEDAWLATKTFMFIKLHDSWSEKERKFKDRSVLAFNDYICVSEKGFTQDTIRYAENKSLEVFTAATHTLLQHLGASFFATEILKRTSIVGERLAVLGDTHVFRLLDTPPHFSDRGDIASVN